MPKLILTILAIVAVLAILLQIRQQQAAVRSDTLRLHRDIRNTQRTLFQQQVLIGANLAPGAIEHQLDVPMPRFDEDSAWDAVLAGQASVR
ncbi:MAG: hypothetical protein AAGD32_15565 [Planctomycetota bacterium]